MLLAARVLAATAWDLFNDPETIEAAGRELRGRLTDARYEAMLEPGQTPPLDYRKPPRCTDVRPRCYAFHPGILKVWLGPCRRC